MPGVPAFARPLGIRGRAYCHQAPALDGLLDVDQLLTGVRV